MNLTEFWSSDKSGLNSATDPCQNITPHDRDTTITASQVIIACGTGLFYLVILALGILGVWVKSCARLCSSQGTFFVFFIGALVASVNVFTNSDNLEVKLYFRASTASTVGIAFALFGAYRFFSLPEEGGNERTLGDQQPSMGCVVGVITFPLFLLEAVLLVLALTKKPKEAETDPTLWAPIIADKLAFLLQKPIQVGIYLYLRSTTSHMVEYKENAEFYFRILSFFNLIEWLDAQVNVDNDVKLSGPIIEKLDGWFHVFVLGYKALIIDYRLLRCLLFLEHSVEIGNEDQDDVEAQENEVRYVSCMTPRDRLKMYGGFFVGCLCLTAPVFCGLYYLDSLHIRASVQLLAIIVNLASIVLGARLLCMNYLEQIEGKKESLGVKIMVCCLGAVGFICWLVTAAIAGYWAATAADRKDLGGKEPSSHMGWNAAKYGFRGLMAAFLMYLFMKINARALPLQNHNKKINHFFVPVVMLGIFSMSLESLLDQYAGAMESTLRCEIKEKSLKILLGAGPPMYLGFLIHLFLHFFIIWLNLGKRAENDLGASHSSFDTCSSQAYVSCTDLETSSHESESENPEAEAQHLVPAVTIF